MITEERHRAAIVRRLKLLKALEGDAEAQAAAVVVWRDDPVRFINDCVWTQDPRLLARGMPADIPLELFEFQVDFVEWLQECYRDQESGVVEKSRDMGASWAVLAWYAWLWLFEPGVQLALGSRKEALVDKKGDPDSLLERFRYILSKLPRWLAPQGFDRRVHDNFLLIRNPENGSVLSGEGGDNIGRGGRKTVYVVDEAAHLERAEKVDAALSNNSDVIIYVSSANGMNLFQRKATSGAYRVKRLHWSMDPRKSPEWRQRMIDKLGPVIVAQEVDIDYSASVEGIIIPAAWVQSAVALYKTHADQLDEYRAAPRILGLDVADGGGDLTVLVHRAGPLVIRVDERSHSDTTKTARWAHTLASSNGCDLLLFDSIGVGAGVFGELNSLDREGGKGYPHRPVNVGMAPTKRRAVAGAAPSQIYANLKAELWWNLRRRFELTHLYVTGERDADGNLPDLDDLIALPEHDKLIQELSVVTHYIDGRGKIRVEGKADLKKRLGADASPDFADALVLAYASDVLGAPVKREHRQVVAPRLQIHQALDLGF